MNKVTWRERAEIATKELEYAESLGIADDPMPDGDYSWHLPFSTKDDIFRVDNDPVTLSTAVQRRLGG